MRSLAAGDVASLARVRLRIPRSSCPFFIMRTPLSGWKGRAYDSSISPGCSPHLAAGWIGHGAGGCWIAGWWSAFRNAG